MHDKKVLYSVLLMVGVIAIIIGFIFIAYANGDHSTNGNGLVRASTATEFGADFYTEVYQATALAANTLTDVYKLLSRAFGIFFILFGCVDVCISLMMTGRSKNVNKTMNTEDSEQGVACIMSDISADKD